MSPLDCVVVLRTGAYKDQAGTVEKVERDEDGKAVSAVVDMDTDHKRVRFALTDLRVIKAHG